MRIGAGAKGARVEEREKGTTLFLSCEGSFVVPVPPQATSSPSSSHPASGRRRGRVHQPRRKIFRPARCEMVPNGGARVRL